MGVMDRYGRDKNGNVVRDGQKPSVNRNRASSVDVETVLQQSYAKAIKKQPGTPAKKRRVPTPQDIQFAKEGYQGNHKKEYFDTKNNLYRYPGKDYVYPNNDIKLTPFQKFKRWMGKLFKR